jgi:hypothetical protein
VGGSRLLVGLVDAVELQGRVVEVHRERLCLPPAQVAQDDVGQQRVRADFVDVVERPSQPVVVEPARLHALAEQQLQVDVLEPLVHPPQRDPPRQDVEDHHREALCVRGVRQRVAREVFVERGEDAELVEAGTDDGKVPDRQAADFEVVDGHQR